MGIENPYTMYKHITKWVPTCNKLNMYSYEDNHTGGEEGFARYAFERDSKSKRSVKNGCMRCVCMEDLCFDGRWQHTPAPKKRSPNPKENTGLHTHISFSHDTHIHLAFSLHK